MIAARPGEVSHGLSAAWPTSPPSGFSSPALTPAPEGGAARGALLGPPRCQGSSHSQEAALTSLLGLPQERLHVCLKHTCSCEENRGARLPPEATLALLPSCSPAPAPGRVAVLPGPTRGPEAWVLRPSGGEGWRAAEAGWVGGGSRQCYSEGLRAAGEGRPPRSPSP